MRDFQRFVFLIPCWILPSMLPELYAASEGLTKQSIGTTVSANQEDVKSCYAAVAQRVPGLSGKFRLEIKVSRSGKVETVKVKDSTLPIADVEKCVESKVKKWTFAAPLSNQPSSFSYPFAFGAASSGKTESSPLPGAPQTVNDSQPYKGKIFKKSNRAIEDPFTLQEMAQNPLIKAKADNCENTRVLLEKCSDLDDKDRVVCSAMIDSPPRKPATTDWAMIDHPDAYRIVSGVYFLGYWHVACQFVKGL
ncbi:MAG: energy transducer TonB [Proteobacteria bacterium]|nr:MAG: energy transducer TonB [Pseudomonadota bacterium]